MNSLVEYSVFHRPVILRVPYGHCIGYGDRIALPKREVCHDRITAKRHILLSGACDGIGIRLPQPSVQILCSEMSMPFKHPKGPSGLLLQA